MNAATLRAGLLACCAVVLAGCASAPPSALPPTYSVSTGLTLPTRPSTDPSQLPESDTAPDSRKLEQTATPQLTIRPSAVAGLRQEDVMPAMTTVTPVNINVENVPVPMLANEVYGNLLGLNVSMDPAVAAMQELVTLNTQNNLTPQELFKLARQVLSEYGVAVVVEADLVRLQAAGSATSAIPPLIVSGRAMPDVPISHRPVFQLVELEVVRSGDAARWLTTLFGQELKVLDETSRNAVLINGKPQQVRQAIDALRVFDRPLMRGRSSTRLEPAFLSAEQLADRLIDVLNLQGYGANRSVGSPSSVIVLPVPATNSVLLFATTQETLTYAVSWARELDRANPQAGSQSMFYYQVKNTKATEIAKVLTTSMASNAAAVSASTASSSAPANSAAPGAASAPANNRNTAPTSSIMVDEPRNALIYQGEATQWQRMLGLIQQMDRSPRQVMIEVTIAEVKLDDKMDFGVTWFAKNGFGRFRGRSFGGSGSGGTSPATSSSGGLTFLLDDVTGRNRAALNAFAEDSRVTVLSKPRLLIKSGSEGNIDVGDEVPTVTMQTTSNQQTGGTTNLLQSIQYRKTGVILKIKPTIYSDNRIDLDIAQEVSDVQPTSSNTTDTNSPSIFNRSLSTSLTLRDGGSVIMGGIISNRATNTDGGIPLLKDIPGLGNLFKTKGRDDSRTELVLIIVPYIVESDERAASISQAIVDQLELLEINTDFSVPGPRPAESPLPPPVAPYPEAVLPPATVYPIESNR